MAARDLFFFAPWFKKEHERDMQITFNNHIYLPEDDPGAIELFVTWLYHGQSTLTIMGLNLGRLLAFYTVADKWQLILLKNSIMTILVGQCSDNPSKGLEMIVKSADPSHGMLWLFLALQAISLTTKAIPKAETLWRICILSGHFAADGAYHFTFGIGGSKAQRLVVEVEKFLE